MSIDERRLQEQREMWLRATAAVEERKRERDEKTKRLNAEVERAEERAAAEFAKLQDLAEAERERLERFLALPSDEETAKAEAALQRIDVTLSNGREHTPTSGALDESSAG